MELREEDVDAAALNSHLAPSQAPRKKRALTQPSPPVPVATPRPPPTIASTSPTSDSPTEKAELKGSGVLSRILSPIRHRSPKGSVLVPPPNPLGSSSSSGGNIKRTISGPLFQSQLLRPHSPTDPVSKTRPKTVSSLSKGDIVDAFATIPTPILVSHLSVYLCGNRSLRQNFVSFAKCHANRTPDEINLWCDILKYRAGFHKKPAKKNAKRAQAITKAIKGLATAPAAPNKDRRAQLVRNLPTTLTADMFDPVAGTILNRSTILALLGLLNIDPVHLGIESSELDSTLAKSQSSPSIDYLNSKKLVKVKSKKRISTKGFKLSKSESAAPEDLDKSLEMATKPAAAQLEAGFLKKVAFDQLMISVERGDILSALRAVSVMGELTYTELVVNTRPCAHPHDRDVMQDKLCGNIFSFFELQSLLAHVRAVLRASGQEETATDFQLVYVDDFMSLTLCTDIHLLSLKEVAIALCLSRAVLFVRARREGVGT